MQSSLRIGLVGPDQSQSCGIADYTARLASALSGACDLVSVPFREALTGSRLNGCRGILVQYERSLLAAPGLKGGDEFLSALSGLHPGRVFVVPHEVYAQDPFAFPYENLRSAFPPLLWAKRLRYWWSHRAYAEEKRLQARAYHAHRVIPLSGPGAEILRALVSGKILDPVPLAFFTPAGTRVPGGEPRRESFFSAPPKAVLGIFGFLNPGLDYASALDLLADLDAGVCLLLLGGDRNGGGWGKDMRGELSQAIADRGLQGRVHVTGYLPEAGLDAALRMCDAFLCPMRFKSNSSSLLNLIHLGKPILASDLPLTRYLKAQGAPLGLYAGRESLRKMAEDALSGALPAQANRYPWDFAAVASAYLRILSAAR